VVVSDELAVRPSPRSERLSAAVGSPCFTAEVVDAISEPCPRGVGSYVYPEGIQPYLEDPVSAETRPDDDERIERSQPLLFISHRHDDREIADLIRNFVTYLGGNEVVVYQTSSSDAQAPKIGRNVNHELMRALWKTDVLVLIYTRHDRDWDYCMWECGVATHSESDDTNVIVLQCGRQLPRVFADQVAVDVRDPEKLRRFVNAFLTDPHFFRAAAARR
jgi:hypothetical protein